MEKGKKIYTPEEVAETLRAAGYEIDFITPLPHTENVDSEVVLKESHRHRSVQVGAGYLILNEAIHDDEGFPYKWRHATPVEHPSEIVLQLKLDYPKE